MTNILLFAERANLSIGLLFWLIFIIATIFGGIGVFRNRDYWFAGGGLVLWVLLLLLGIGVFGFPIG